MTSFFRKFLTSGPQLFVGLFCVIISLIALASRHVFDGYVLYFAVVLAAWAIFHFNITNSRPINSQRRELSGLILGLVFSGAMAVIAYTIYPQTRFWLDEQIQLDYSLDLNRAISNGASESQQPILSYVFTYFLSLFFGDSILTVRMLGIIPMILCVFTLVLGSVKRFGIATACCFGLYVLTNQYWHYHLFEGRSVALALFFLILALLAITDSLRDCSKTNLSTTFIYVFLFFNTIGLQSNFLLLSFVIILFILQVIDLKDTRFIKLSLPIIIAVLVSTPFQLSILDQSTRYMNPESSQELILTYLKNWNLAQFHQYYQFFASRFIDGMFEKLILLSLIVLYFRKRVYSYHILMGYFLLAVLFPLMFDAFFNIKVRWLLQPRYFETWRSTQSLASIFIIMYSFKGLFRHSSKLIFSLLTMIILFGYHGTSGPKEIYLREIEHRSDWKTIFSELEPFALKGKNILYLSNCKPTDLVCYEWNWGGKYWSSPEVTNKIKLNIERDAFDQLDHSSVLLIERPWDNPKVEFSQEHIENIRIKEVENFLILSPKSGELSGIDLLRIARDYRSKRHPGYYQPVYILALHAAENNDKEELSKNLKILTEMIPASTLAKDYHAISAKIKALQEKLNEL